MPLLWDIPQGPLYRMIRDLDDPFDVTSLMTTCEQFRGRVIMHKNERMQITPGPLSVRRLLFIPTDQGHHYAAMLRFIALSSESREDENHEDLALKIHELWYMGVTGMQEVTDHLTQEIGVGCLHANVFPFIQDYIFKAANRSDTTRLAMYEKAPCWAHPSLARIAEPPQALFESEMMRQAFATLLATNSIKIPYCMISVRF
ncbi:hypothetical protein F4782DRAFT_532575 [Xylaria castorea]|nr:hypothetical protein F4782DRAFT_532575 [Xylaria castorea]